MQFNEKIRMLRLQNNVKAKDLASELLMSPSQYSEIERGRKVIKPDYQEVFLEDVETAIQKLNSQTWVDRDGLEWNRVTPNILMRAKKDIQKGKNVIQVSIKYGVSDEELLQHLGVGGSGEICKEV